MTMPGKFAALRFADEATDRAKLVGAANTLVRTETGWRADNTDVDGLSACLRAVLGDLYARGHRRVLAEATAPVVLHWLGTVFDRLRGRGAGNGDRRHRPGGGLRDRSSTGADRGRCC